MNKCLCRLVWCRHPGNMTEMELITVALEDLLNNYDKRIRPGYGGDPVEVQLNINIRSLGPISEKDMSFTMDCYFRQVWVDKRLAMLNNHTHANYTGFIQLSIKILERIWYPDTVFYNGMKSYLHTITTPNRFIRIFRNGQILFSQRLTVRAMCKMELRKYPLDEQNCPLHIGSFAYSTQDVTYFWRPETPVEMPKDMRLSQFDMLGTPFNYTSVDYFKGAWHTVLSVDFRLSRHLGYFLINVYVPCCLLVILSWVAFWINREATADRIALGTMTVLTMTFLGLESRSDLPRVSYTTALDIYIAMAFVFVLATMVQFAAVHNFTKHGYGEPMPPPPGGHTTEEEEDENNEREKLLHSRRTGTRTARLKRQHAISRASRHSATNGAGNSNGGHHFSRVSMKRAASKVWRRLTRLSRKKDEQETNSVSNIDRVSRIMFPLVFLIFNVIYCLVYYSL
ncbi:gamma-aminobutyric acid receptor alpha-like isoform X2 [Dreissena polymorpha]|uniref:gamma-aminobutyric acid receptor alpha-like isoform X2 n=1 Tax=Dreissena polymorpha TaxID=45954 RepID=UPI00226405D6|nr:gamma-aminobutyric acid receptor alpha-like isoform X2 [Dreissena polymorpha]